MIEKLGEKKKLEELSPSLEATAKSSIRLESVLSQNSGCALGAGKFGFCFGGHIDQLRQWCGGET